MRRRKAAVWVTAILIAVIAGWFARNLLLRETLEGTVALVTGYRLHLGSAHAGSGHLVLRDVELRRRGDPVLRAQTVDVEYVLRDLFPGGKRRFGLVGVFVERPQLYLIRRKDGSFNISFPKSQPPRKPTKGPPWLLDAKATDGSIDLIDVANLDPAARHIHIGGLQVSANVDTAAVTRYRAEAVLGEGNRIFPISARAAIDMTRGYGMHHILAPNVPLRGLGNFLINSGVALIQKGALRDLDVKVYALALHPDAPAAYHLAGGARLDGVEVKLDVLTQTVNSLRGPIAFDDDAIVSPKIAGQIGKTPLVLAGGMYDFSEPKFRLAVKTREDLRILHRDFNFLRTEPLAGELAATCLLEGAISDPLILADATGKSLFYRTIPVHDFRATIAYHHGVVFAGDVTGTVGGVKARVAAQFLVGGPDVGTEVALTAGAPPGEMPYLDRITPRAATRMTMAAEGLNLLLDTRGILEASGGGEHASALFALNPHGVGELGAFTVRQPTGGIDGAFMLDREHGTSALWANAAGLVLHPASPRAILHGVDIPPFPPIAGRFDGQLAGVDINQHLVLLGQGRAQRAEFAGVPIAQARANFGGPLEHLALGQIDARGEFGHFVGRGALRAPGFAFDGRLDGTLEGMRRWTGNLGAFGKVRGPITIASDGTRTLIQTTGVGLRDASIHGIPLGNIAGTFSVEPTRVVVYAATAGVGTGRAVARGNSVDGIRLTSSGIDATNLRGAGLPMNAGLLVGRGDLRFGADDPSFAAEVALKDGRVQGRHVDGNAKLTIAGDSLEIDRASIALAHALGFVDGTVSNMGAVPRYDLHANVSYADLGGLSNTFHLPVKYLSGMLAGDVHVGGEGNAPNANGTLRVPVGSINGLDFFDAAAKVAVDRQGVIADGNVTVGTTRAQFGVHAAEPERSIAARFDAGDANLADFNNYFQAAGTLDGRGSLHARFSRENGRVSSSGSVDLVDLRFRTFPFGHTVASWNGGNGKIAANLQSSGIGGSIDAGGTAVVPSGTKLAHLPSSTQLDLRGALHDVDLNVWLPAFGYTPPVLGHVNASGAVHGRFPALALDVDAGMDDGRIGRIPIDRVHINAAAQSGTGGAVRTEIRSAEIAIGGLDLQGRGSIGLRPQDPLTLDMDARTPHLHDFIQRVSGKDYDLDGIADVHLAVRGTASKPSATASFSVTPLQISHLVIPSVVGSFAVDRERFALRDAAINFQSGKILLSGGVPLSVGQRMVAATLPLSFDLNFDSVGMSQLAALAPSRTKLDGTLSGKVQVRGSVSQPRLAGRVDLIGGGYSGTFETLPITGVNAGLAFNETSVELSPFEATVGGGSLRGSGLLQLPGTQGAGASTPVYNADFTLNAVRLAFAGYGSGRGDGTISLRGAPPGKPGILSGDVTISEASVPLTDFLKASASPSSAAFNLSPATPTIPVTPALTGLVIPPWLSDLGLDLRVAMGNAVRIRSPILDIGGKGEVLLAGRLAEPTLDGRFDATPGGSLYLNRAFKVQEASVRFSPRNGIAPNLFARATTQIVPVSGVQPVDVTVTAQGLIPDVKLSYSSNPPFDEATIVGLLFNATALGASVGSLNTFAPTTNILLPPNAFQQTPSGTFALSQEASSLINAQFTARLLAPVEQGLGSAFGLSDLSINVAPTGSVGVQARRLLGHNTYALYGTSLQYPYRMTFGLESRPSPETSWIFTAFTQQGVYALYTVKPDTFLAANPALVSSAFAGGTYGFNVNYQRRSSH